MLAGTPSFWKTATRLWGYFEFSKNKKKIFLVFGCILFSKILLTVAPLFFRESINSLEDGKIFPNALIFVCAYGVLRFVAALFFEIKDILYLPLELNAIRTMSVQVFNHMQYSSYSFHLDRKTGALLRIIERGGKGVEDFMRFFVFYTLPLLFEMLLVCVFLWTTYPPFFGWALFSTFVLYGAFTFLMTQFRLNLLREMNVLDNKSSTKSLDTLINYATVKYFHREAEETTLYAQFVAQRENINFKMRSSLAFLNMGQALVLSGGLLSVLLYSLYSAKAGIMRIGDFGLINLYVLQFLMPLHLLGFSYREIKQSWVNLKEMFGLLEVSLETDDEKNAVPIRFKGGEIEFQNVSFTYIPGISVLTQCSFTIPAGKTVALVGPSGSGKTTISSLLVRFFEVQQGGILVDGQDIQTVTRRSVRQLLGVVPQDTVLFDETIAYNLRYGNPEASYEEVQAAAQKARVHDFIQKLPQGYETRVGERGLKLSGGEKQRLAIARVLLCKPNIFIFDEATSALDAVTEKEIQANIREISQGHTTLIIAHRLSTIQDADWILVLNEGSVTEEGTHKDLLHKKGLYAALWFRQQFGDVPAAPHPLGSPF